MEERNILLTNIQRFCIHDGPGIRTTIFFKGCSLRCPWCSNPENLSSYVQKYIKNGVEGVYGHYYSASEVVNECLKDQNFYDGKINSPSSWRISTAADIDLLPGGVTFSGGECLLQAELCVQICRALHESGIHIAVETSLFVPTEKLLYVIEHIDLFYVDMKILHPDRCKTVEHGDLDLYLANLNTLLSWSDSEGRRKPVVIRIPVIGTHTDGDENRKSVHDLLEKYRGKILKIELIKEHNLGEMKYKSMNMKADYKGVDDHLMEQYKNELADLGIFTEICKL